MSQLDLSVNFFVTLLALVDPIGNVPVFAAATAGATAAGRRRLATYIALFVLGFMTFFLVTGLALLDFFGITMPAFRIAGGVILFLLGLDMARDDFTAKYADVAEAADQGDFRVYARRRFERLIVPFAMPLLIGPGAISTVVIYASEARPFGWMGVAWGIGVIFAIAVLTQLCFWATPLISRVLGRIGMTIVVRVLGLILCAMAVQFVLLGVSEATVGVIRPEAAAPYAH